MSRFTVQGSGSHWAVLDGQRAIASFSTWWRDDAHADRLARAARRQPRRCLTCETTFISDGPHNRMCVACRQQ